MINRNDLPDEKDPKVNMSEISTVSSEFNRSITELQVSSINGGLSNKKEVNSVFSVNSAGNTQSIESGKSSDNKAVTFITKDVKDNNPSHSSTVTDVNSIENNNLCLSNYSYESEKTEKTGKTPENFVEPLCEANLSQAKISATNPDKLTEEQKQRFIDLVDGSRYATTEKCSDCSGTGLRSKDRTTTDCFCKMRAKVNAYLAMYSGGEAINGLDCRILFRKNILVQRSDWLECRRFIKTFLAWGRFFPSYACNKHPPVDHITVDAFEVLDAYFNNQTDQKFNQLKKAKILFLRLTKVPPNKLYDSLLTFLFESRSISNNCVTWIYSPFDISSHDFTEIYSKSLSEFLKKQINRKSLWDVDPIVFLSTQNAVTLESLQEEAF